MARRRLQTSLPEDQQTAVTDETGYSIGLPYTQEIESISATPRRPVRKSATLIRNPSHKFNSGAIRVSAVSQVALSDNPQRRFLLIQNVGINICYLGFGVPASASTGVELNAGFYQSFEEGICPNNGINAVSPIGTTLIIIEGVEF